MTESLTVSPSPEGIRLTANWRFLSPFFTWRSSEPSDVVIPRITGIGTLLMRTGEAVPGREC